LRIIVGLLALASLVTGVAVADGGPDGASGARRLLHGLPVADPGTAVRFGRRRAGARGHSEHCRAALHSSGVDAQIVDVGNHELNGSTHLGANVEGTALAGRRSR